MALWFLAFHARRVESKRGTKSESVPIENVKTLKFLVFNFVIIINCLYLQLICQHLCCKGILLALAAQLAPHHSAENMRLSSRPFRSRVVVISMIYCIWSPLVKQSVKVKYFFLEMYRCLCHKFYSREWRRLLQTSIALLWKSISKASLPALNHVSQLARNKKYVNGLLLLLAPLHTWLVKIR